MGAKAGGSQAPSIVSTYHKEIPSKCHRMVADATKAVDNECHVERDWLTEISVGTCVPVSSYGLKAPSPSAGPQRPHVTQDNHYTLLLHLPAQGAAVEWAGGDIARRPLSGAKQQFRGLFSRGLGQGASVLALPPISQSSLSPSPGGPSHLPGEALSTLPISCLLFHQGVPRALGVILHSIHSTSSSQPLAAVGSCCSYLPSKLVGSSERLGLP